MENLRTGNFKMHFDISNCEWKLIAQSTYIFKAGYQSYQQLRDRDEVETAFHL